MKWLRVLAFYECERDLAAEDLVADIFFSSGVAGVEISLPGRRQELAETAFVSGYIPFSALSNEVVDKIRSKGRELGKYGIKVKVATELMDDQEWSQTWKQFFHVSRITERIVVKPTWCDYKEKPEDIVVEIDPGGAFGTGTHPSTFLCIKLLEHYVKPGSAFLDIGTGSGILVITADRLGAGVLLGIDTDAAAKEVAGRNVWKSGIPADRCRILHAAVEDLESREFDVICANIVAETIIAMMPEIRKKLVSGGMAILSGIIREKEKKVKACLQQHGLSVHRTETFDEWVAVAAARS